VPEVPTGCPSPFAPFVSSSGGITIQSAGEYRITLQQVYTGCTDAPYYCHGWVQMQTATRSLLRIVAWASGTQAVGGPTESFYPNMAVSIFVSEADIPAFVSVLFYAGTVASMLQNGNPRFLQVERIADYTGTRNNTSELSCGCSLERVQ
jgi:hypothetical protein